MLTRQQKAFLEWLVKEAQNRREFPTFQEMVDFGSAAHRSHAHNMVSRLNELGFVERLAGTHIRPYRVTSRGVAYVANPQGMEGDPVGPKATIYEARRAGIELMANELLKGFSAWPTEQRELLRREVYRVKSRAIDIVARGKVDAE